MNAVGLSVIPDQKLIRCSCCGRYLAFSLFQTHVLLEIENGERVLRRPWTRKLGPWTRRLRTATLESVPS